MNKRGQTWSGHSPDVLESLANERNGLAWQRTALSWLAAGAAVARYFSADGLLTARASIGWLMLGAGGAIWFTGVRRYHSRDSSLRADRPTPAPAQPIAIISIVTALVIAAIIAIEVAYW